MRAAICRELGPPEAVVVDEVDAPALGPGQARVRVEAASVNFPDVLIVAGEYQIPVAPPFVPGSELAGTVVELADDVADGADGDADDDGPEAIRVGDRVFGTTLVGAFAQEAVIGAAALTRAPAGVDAATLAAFGVAHRTAYHVLRSVASLREGDELVVLGAGGGVGLATVQLGVVLGARVTAVASSPEKLEVARAFGATTLLDHRAVDLKPALKAALPQGADVVVDPVGGDLAEPALRALRWGGRFVTVGYASGVIPRIPLNLVLLKGVQVLGFQFLDWVAHAPDQIERNERELLALLAEGLAYPHIGARFPLEDAVGALRHVADGKAIGKVVLDVG